MGPCMAAAASAHLEATLDPMFGNHKLGATLPSYRGVILAATSNGFWSYFYSSYVGVGWMGYSVLTEWDPAKIL